MFCNNGSLHVKDTQNAHSEQLFDFYRLGFSLLLN